jgi:hypothetical protein
MRSECVHFLQHGFARGKLHEARSSSCSRVFIVGTVIGKCVAISIAVSACAWLMHNDREPAILTIMGGSRARDSREFREVSGERATGLAWR